MSDTSLTPAADPVPTAPTRWDWKPSLRWFAAEIAVVVTGVLIALTLNAWWQGQQNTQREHAYLNEIRRDLIETESSLQYAVEGVGITRSATSSLIRSAYAPDAVPRDSLARWLFEAQYIRFPTYRMGTANALIETGDLQLVHDDSTRIALSRLVDDVQRAQTIERTLLSLIAPGVERLRKSTAPTNLYADLARLPSYGVPRLAEYIESHAQTIPEGGHLAFAEDYANLLGDADAFRDWRAMSDHFLVLQTLHREILERVQQTLQQVEAELNG